jgi:thymidylate synthase
MASVIHLTSGYQDYWQLVQWVAHAGTRRTPRGIPTRDVGPTLIEITDPIHSLPYACGRGVKPSIGAVEAAQLIGGFSDPNLMLRISPNFQKFIEPDGQFWGAYGTRIGNQLVHVIRKLQEDPDTRQAVVTLWQPHVDNRPLKRDYPCTVGFDFTIIDGMLCMNTVMRSNDVWLGFAYDLFQFTQLQLTVANALNIPPGLYTHMVWSLHIYERNLCDVDKLHAPSEQLPYHPHGFGRHGHDIEHIMNRAKYVTTRDTDKFYDLTPSEAWYHEQLRQYVCADERSADETVLTPVVGSDVASDRTRDVTQIIV